MGLMKFVISWWKCLPYNKLERLSCTEVTHRSLLLGVPVKSAAASVCVLLPPSPLQKTDRLLRHCPEERLVQHSSCLMQTCRERRLPGACQPQAVMLHLWWTMWKRGHHISAAELRSPITCFINCSTLPQWQWDGVSCICLLLHNEDQMRPVRKTTCTKPDNKEVQTEQVFMEALMLPMNEGRLGSTKGMAVTGWACGQHQSCW